MSGEKGQARLLNAGTRLLEDWLERAQGEPGEPGPACEVRIYLKGGTVIELRARAVQVKYNGLGELIGLDLQGAEPELVHLDCEQVAAVVTRRIDDAGG